MIARAAHHLRELGRWPLAAADAGMNRLYGWRYNPLYHAGALVLVAFVAMVVTGIYLLLYYRIGSPYESMVRIESQVWTGRWIRALHRYAADVAVAASVVHAFRMFVQGRTWGARASAWLSGLVLFFLIFVSGWTGYVMMWDDHAQLLAIEGARLLDALPIFAEPISRTFVGDRPIPSAFFFLNLFAHIGFPMGMALVMWIHVSRVSRPVLMPPRGLLWGSLLLLFGVSVLYPAPLGPKADVLSLLGTVEIDWFYSFWVPVSRLFEPVWVWLFFLSVTLVLCLVPWWSRPVEGARLEPSVVQERLCTGCVQCSLDCPYDAIDMIEVHGGRAERVSRVDPKLCVSCGICSASCAPMALGPPQHTGRDELVQVRAFLSEHGFGPGDVIVVACRRGAGRVGSGKEMEGAIVYPIDCAGHLHTSVIELLIRSGVGGVLVASCPPRDCRNREGPKWLEERVHQGREAELRESIDRRRIQLVYAGEGERRVVLRELEAFRGRVRSLDRAPREDEIEIDTECEPPEVEAAS